MRAASAPIFTCVNPVATLVSPKKVLRSKNVVNCCSFNNVYCSDTDATNPGCTVQLVN